MDPDGPEVKDLADEFRTVIAEPRPDQPTPVVTIGHPL